MIKKYVTLILLILAVFWLRWLSTATTIVYYDQILNSLISYVVIYFIFEILISSIGKKYVHGYKERYSFNRIVTTSQAAILIFVLSTIWAQSIQALFVAYGLIAAGVALALQDVFKNFVGGLLLLTRGYYKVGDRIEIGTNAGDVIDIGMFNTTVFEIRNWIDGDQGTGRLITIPNGQVLSQPIFNYTKDNLIIWDELKLPITHNSNWKKAQSEFVKIANRTTKNYIDQAEIEIKKLSSKYYLDSRDAKPVVYISANDNWIDLNLRYVTLARERRLAKNNLYIEILELIEREDDISIASTTLDIIGFPKNKN